MRKLLDFLQGKWQYEDDFKNAERTGTKGGFTLRVMSFAAESTRFFPLTRR